VPPAATQREKSEIEDFAPHSRFLGWKRATKDGSRFERSCGAACLPGAPSVFSAAGLALPQLSNSALSGFALRSTLPAGAIPTAVVAGDFNGDGHLDWAISNGADNSIWLYLGRGDGTSNLPTIVSLTGIAPTWLTAVSLRGNGILDLVVAEADSSTIGVLLGNGDGTFQPESDYGGWPTLSYKGDSTVAPPFSRFLREGRIVSVWAQHPGAPAYAPSIDTQFPLRLRNPSPTGGSCSTANPLVAHTVPAPPDCE
jgi:hypothetical protein